MKESCEEGLAATSTLTRTRGLATARVNIGKGRGQAAICKRQVRMPTLWCNGTNMSDPSWQVIG